MRSLFIQQELYETDKAIIPDRYYHTSKEDMLNEILIYFCYFFQQCQATVILKTVIYSKPVSCLPQLASSDPSAQSGSSSHTHSLEMQCLVVLHWKWSGEQLFSALKKKKKGFKN